MGTVFDDLSKIQQAFAGATSIASLIVDRTSGEDPGNIVLVHPSGEELVLPGIVQRIWVGGNKHDFEGVAIEGRSGEVKLYHGETPAEVYVETWLIDDDETSWGEDLSQWLTLNFGDAYNRTRELTKTAKKYKFTALEKLVALNALFHARDDVTMTPIIYGIKNPHINVRLGNDAKVVFEEMTTETVAARSIIVVQMKLVEYEPAMAIVELGKNVVA